MSSTQGTPLTAAHYTRRWLPQTQTWLYNQVRYLPDTIESHVICERTENLDQFDIDNLHCLAEDAPWQYYRDVPLRFLGIRSRYPYTVEQVRESGAQLLHTHFGDYSWQTLEVSRQTGIRHVVTFYGNDVTSYPQQDEKWIRRYRTLFNHVDGILCEGPHMAQSVVDLGCPEEKVHVHHLGVPVNSIRFQPRTYEPDEPLRVLIAASFREKKGIPYAMEALGRLQEEVPLEVTVIGGVAEVPILGNWSKSVSGSEAEKERILSAIDEWGLDDQVRLMGYQPHDVLMEEAYEHHVFLQPSVTAQNGDGEGGAPVTLIEMSATGMPIVSTEHCDIPSVVKHNETGFLAPERDPDALARHLRRLVKAPNRWAELGRAGRAHVEAEYNAQVQGQRLADRYREILDA
jgi:colanic acid/amylovoran biosynthesis glycosyltransferase